MAALSRGWKPRIDKQGALVQNVLSKTNQWKKICMKMFLLRLEV